MACSLSQPLDFSFPFIGSPQKPGSETHTYCVGFSDIIFKDRHNWMQVSVSHWQILVFKMGTELKINMSECGLYIQHLTSSSLLLIICNFFLCICQSGGGQMALLPA